MSSRLNESSSHNLSVLLASEERNFLVRNNGEQVKIDDVVKKMVGLYFSGYWCAPCRRFTPTLVEAYEELSSNCKGDFEVVFISSDRDDESFNGYFGKMPWTAIPFSDSESRNRLNKSFKVRGIPYLVILDESGKVLSDQGVKIIGDYGAEGYPFTSERLGILKEEEETAKKEQSLRSLLVSSARDYVVSNDGNKIPVLELEGKTVGFYFFLSFHGGCIEFTPKLSKMYKKLREKGESFEIVLISLEDEEDEFKESFKSMPWLALPFKDKICEKLVRFLELRALPALVVIGPDGKTLHSNAVNLIEEHGAEAYPFSEEKLMELAEIEKERLKAQTLESLLVSEERDYVISKSGDQVPVSELVGKNVLLFFSAHWCPPCRAFLSKLISAYHDIKAKDDAFEVIFISSDSDRSSFDEYFSSMPWLALPFGDERKAFLQRRFKVRGIPFAIAIGQNGHTVSTTAQRLIESYGADAYPFSEEREKQVKERIEEMAKGWPEKLKVEVHEHELVRSRRNGYVCDGCDELGHGWSFYCKDCDFDLHPNCALNQTRLQER